MIKYEKLYFYLINNLNNLSILWGQKQRIFDFFGPSFLEKGLSGLFKKL